MQQRLTLICLTVLLLATGCSKQTTAPPLAPGAVVIAFGDSITHGTGAAAGEDYPTLLGEATGWQMINAGVPGDTAKAARGRIDPLLRAHQPDLVIVELGGNDFLRRRNPAEVKADLAAILATIETAGVPAVLVAVPHFSVLRATLGALDDAPLYNELAEEAGALLIPDLLSDILSTEDWRADAIHPNASGYEAFAAGIHEQLQAAGLTP